MDEMMREDEGKVRRRSGVREQVKDKGIERAVKGQGFQGLQSGDLLPWGHETI